VTAGSQAIGAAYRNDFSLPGTQSQAALDALERHSPGQIGETLQIVVADSGGLRQAATQARVNQLLDRVRGLPHVDSVTELYSDPFAVAGDGTVGYATVTLDGPAADVPSDAVRRVITTVRDAQGDGLRAAVGGEAVRAAEEAEDSAAEGAGLLAAIAILVLMFGSFLAASLPLVVAVFAVGSTLGLVVLASHVASIADFTPPLMLLVGLGVGIDYALLVFYRYRSELIRGADSERAVRVALDTAGRTVFLAASTVILALLGLVALGLGSLQGVALGVAVTVLITMVASLTLLPAMLAVFGRRIERRVRRRVERRGGPEGDRWRRWSMAVQRHPWLALVAALAALLALAAPALNLRLGFADAGNDAESKSSRQAFDMITDGFGPGFNGPLLVVAEGGSLTAAQDVRAALVDTPGVAAASGPIPFADGEGFSVIVFPESAPQDARTNALVSQLRTDVLPPLSRDIGAVLLVGGQTAALEDFAATVQQRLPWFILVVVGLSALLLMAVFRSLLLPIKAAIFNVLSIGSALGVVTFVFQNGVLGITPGPIEAFIPVMIFAIAFGLSMDYEVFLLSRMHEEWRRSGDATVAVREGIGTTGRVVTAAGAIMVVVFGAFVLSPERMLQQFGLGLAVAILVDVLIIRSLLVPATMQLLGTRAWWLPRWLDRITPRISVEPEAPKSS
jgi:RND superfamily putative drug exporter